MTITVSLQIILSICTLVGIGVSIGMLRSIYLTRKDHEEICSKKQEDYNDNRKAVWEKIDKIYEWAITGVIQIQKVDSK